MEREKKEVKMMRLDGKKEEAAAAVPDELADEVALVGPKERIRDRLAPWRECGVTTLICGVLQTEALHAIAEVGM